MTTRTSKQHKFEIAPLGDSAIMIQFGQSIDMGIHHKIKQLSDYIETHPFHGFIECVPAYVNLTIYYHPYLVWKSLRKTSQLGVISPFEHVKQIVENTINKIKDVDEQVARTIEIPVCYGGDFGPDLHDVATYNNLTVDEVIDVHSNGDYLVYMIGFCPGFPFIGGMSERIATPRRSSPRTVIPEGSVGIAGIQTGVYPIATPGGWQLIGRTPLDLFLPKNDPPSLLQSGDKVRFKPISLEEYMAYQEEK
ncbi:5-oxoprolinase subunit PxpB [Terrilactibacillus laevilacticus]|uniref:5-oxoprolinase subunit PxpB n=1 Tax=Terrilactibacillus laevilacticus TaxID=1380157 RepID=A0ABW5PN41_9BACI|nr:5-oxoprolinase subunit PxpB [Terrilactibacillus laevilacticus]